MKKPAALLAIAAIVGIAYFTLHHYLPEQMRTIFSSREAREEGHEWEGEEGEGEEDELQSGAGRQLSSWFQAKAYPDPNNISEKYQRAWQQFLEIKQRSIGPAARGNVANWTQLGYSQSGGQRIGGRIVCIAIDPSNTNNLWAGSASGGIWKSTNAGTSWTAVVTNLPVLGVSSIMVDPTNSNTIYAGTGEMYNTEVTDAGGFNVWKTRGTYGIGIIRSTDGGATWTQILSRTQSSLFAIQSMLFLPGSTTTIYACATDGVYKTTNSTAATPTWTQIYSGTNVRDIAINPSNTSQAVISVGNMTNPTKGIFRSTNATAASPTWTQITSGLPASFEGYINLDNVGATDLYASIGISSSTANTNREVYRSTDFGANWSVVGGTAAGSTTNHCSYQFWFAHCVAVNPFFTDSIMFGGVGLYRYKVSTTSRNSTSPGHADIHEIKFDSLRRGRIYICTDGGVYKSTDGGATFSNINTGLNATQFYASLGVSRQNANTMIGGLQDNGQVLYNGTTWNAISWGGGDGTSCAIHPTNDQIMLASRDAKQVYRSTDGGSTGSAATTYWGFSGDSRTAFVAPIAFSLSSPTTAYLATDNIHISSNSGASFTNNTLGATPPYPATTPNAFMEQIHKTAIALAVSPTNPNKIYVSTSPYAQYDNDVSSIYVTGTPNVLRSTAPATTPYSSIKGTLPDRFVTDFAISKYSDDSVYVVLGGFGTSHVYLTPDGGTTWTSISAGLPDIPFNAIIIDPVNPKQIYAACDFGVYVSPDRGQTWIDYSTGFTDATMVYDLQIDANNKLIAATHGRGVYRSDLYVHVITPVTLMDFTGTARPTYNELKWTISQEQDLARYELERSADGVSYSRIATVTASNHQSQYTYSYNDITPPAEGYYKLKMINNDGSYTYSSIVFIRRNDGKASFNVVGNIFQNSLALKYKVPADQVILVNLYNTSGALVRKERYASTAGTGFYTINDLQALAPGIYIMNVQSGTEKATFKLLKN